MNKVTRIIALFLKDSTAPKELHRSVLKFTKIAITYLDFKAQPDLMPLMLSHCFALKKPQMYSTLIRRIVSKLMFRCGVKEVKAAITDKSHLALVSHIDREKRKKRNAGEKRRMIAELGKGVGADKETQSLFADIGAEMGADQDMDDKDEGDSSEESEDEEDDVDEEGRPIQGSRYGIDKLASSRKYDIPRVTDIPVISELARMEREKKDGAVQKSSTEDRLK